MASTVSALKLPSLPFVKRLPGRQDISAPKGSEENTVQTPEVASPPDTQSNPRFSANRLFRFLFERKAGMSGWQIPLIGKLRFSRQVEVLAIVVTVLLLLTVATFGLTVRDAGRKREQSVVANDIQVLSQRIGGLAQQAVSGGQDSFKKLEEASKLLAADLELLNQGGEHGGLELPPASGGEIPLLRGIADTFKPIEEQITTILKQERNLLALRKNEEIIGRSGPKVLKLTQQLAKGAVDRGEAYRANAWTQQLHADVLNFDLLDAKQLVSTDQPSPQVALQLSTNIGHFLKTAKGLLEGNPEAGISALQHPVNRDTATDLLKMITELKASVDGIVKNMQDLARAKQAARDAFAGTQNLLGKTEELTSAYREAGAGWGGIAAGLILAMLTLVAFALLAKVLLDDARDRALHSEEENRRNEQAILRLLDDMSDLADGDLTKHAKVTEDMTGAIADSVNYAIDELRSLVTQINSAAGHLTESSTQGRAVSSHLLRVAEKQSDQIQDAAGSVAQMAREMVAVSENASKCADVAKQSLGASETGGKVVQDSIVRMNTLREHIQETSKRIKRLAESSQEIGEIVQLIAGITEQTNVLALNAAIQAAAAGEAGRGFTVVAEEVQRLAERSGEATKQIGALVKTIQNDTQDAMVAMEKSTHGVVQGAQLADSAGRALEQIREVSHRLAELIASISSSTLNQQQVANQLVQRMEEIRNITLQSTKGTKWTAESMAQISNLAQVLKVSVSGFKV